MLQLSLCRKRRGFTQAELAAALGLQSKASISNIESGFRPATFSIAVDIENFFDGEVLAISLLSPDDAKSLRAVIQRAGGKVPAAAEAASA
jgi:transcriptional regulator with XRE-family HTH domain